MTHFLPPHTIPTHLRTHLLNRAGYSVGPTIGKVDGTSGEDTGRPLGGSGRFWKKVGQTRVQREIFWRFSAKNGIWIINIYILVPPGGPHVPPGAYRRPPCAPMSLPEAPHVPPGGPPCPSRSLPGACRVAERLLWATGMYLGGYRDMPRGLPGCTSGATGICLGSYRDMPWELPGGIPRWDPVGNCVEEPGLKKGK